MSAYDMSATYSFEDNKLRLYSLERLAPELYSRVRELGFIYAPKQKLFVAPMWTPAREKILIELCGSIENEDVTAEQRALDRAERFENYSAKRAQDSDRAANAADSMSGAFYGGQPILIGHHSEKKARKLQEKIHNAMDKAVKMAETSTYWASRSKDVMHHVARLARPDVRIRRIKKLQAELRKCEKGKAKAERFIGYWKDCATQKTAIYLANYDHMNLVYPKDSGNPMRSAWSLMESTAAEPVDFNELRPRIIACHERNMAHEQVWIDHTQRRIDYEKACLAESGHSMPDFAGLAKERRKRTVSIPIVNCPGEGIAETDKATWAKIPKDYKCVRKSKCGRYRYRIANERSLVVGTGWDYPQVFIRDLKRVEVPNASNE